MPTAGGDEIVMEAVPKRGSQLFPCSFQCEENSCGIIRILQRQPQRSIDTNCAKFWSHPCKVRASVAPELVEPIIDVVADFEFRYRRCQETEPEDGDEVNDSQ